MCANLPDEIAAAQVLTTTVKSSERDIRLIIVFVGSYKHGSLYRLATSAAHYRHFAGDQLRGRRLGSRSLASAWPTVGNGRWQE
jgi:hypothetical protein